MLIVSALLVTFLQTGQTAIVCTVTASNAPVTGADVIVSGQTYKTDSTGRVRISIAPGSYDLTVVKEGFAPTTATLTVGAGQEQAVLVDLQPQPTVEEYVTVSATRTATRVEDQPMRVEVLGAEEIAEKVLMTPGDIVMMLNEMGGLRVQATSPSLGAASVRIQGMRGRYTRFLSDGLPLFGQAVGGLGLLQIPPTDLGQVEVIKGVASALYGAGALGGVVDLISRRPTQKPIRDALVNRTTRGGTDVVMFVGQPMTTTWSATLLASGHWQEKNDIDRDGWADLAGYSRAVVRPRLFWDNHAGRSLFLTTGTTWEQRRGGTIQGGVVPATGAPFSESLETLRIDGGLVGQTAIAGQYLLTARASMTGQRHDHHIADVFEHDRHDTFFSEVAIRGTHKRQAWIVGAAFERDRLKLGELPSFNYTYSVPGVFAQDDVAIARWLLVSTSARLDVHDQFGTFASPRISALVRRGTWNSRISVGTGFFATTPLTEETEAAGLSRLKIAGRLKAERGRSASWDVTRGAGPLTITATLFRYNLKDPAVVDRATYTLANLSDPTINSGLEAIATFRQAPFSITATYAYVHSREGIGADRSDVPLTPRHSAGLVGMWEDEENGRIGVECYFTGRQRLEDNPYAIESVGYVLFGGLIERRIGRIRVFVNAENLGNVRQSNWSPLLRPFRASDGRWTVDGWAPLDGRVINGGVRIQF